MDILMKEFDAKVQKWGNSYGIRIPKELIDSEGLKEDATVHILVSKAPQTLKGWFGAFKGKGLMSGQEFKNWARKNLYE